MTTSAKIIADSISDSQIRITTMELKYHRFIHSEFMTHRMFSRNASSSRAIPIEKMLKQVEENPAMPVHWGKNQPGMQAREECNELVFIDVNKHDIYYLTKEEAWIKACYLSSKLARNFSLSGYHKQIVNRLLEPFQWIKVIVTATEWDNFFKLRLHPDAQPEIQELARCMKEAIDNSTPKILKPGDWHLPYILDDEWAAFNAGDLSVETLQKASSARCARISFLNHDKTNPDLGKDVERSDSLRYAKHRSPFEHQATPMDFAKDTYELNWEEGVTHRDRRDNLWSANFRGWIQYRQLI